LVQFIAALHKSVRAGPQCASDSADIVGPADHHGARRCVQPGKLPHQSKTIATRQGQIEHDQLRPEPLAELPRFGSGLRHAAHPVRFPAVDAHDESRSCQGYAIDD
jgi:hypothetical protein